MSSSTPTQLNPILTTGQVAKICNVAPRTVSKWFDSGRLLGYRIPGSLDRRIPKHHLIRFLKENAMPLGNLEDLEDSIQVLVLAGDENFVETLSTIGAGKISVVVVASLFEAGIKMNELLPSCVILGTRLSAADVERTAREIRKSALVDERLSIIALLSAHERQHEFAPGLVNERFGVPFEVEVLAYRIIQSASRK